MIECALRRARCGGGGNARSAARACSMNVILLRARMTEKNVGRSTVYGVRCTVYEVMCAESRFKSKSLPADECYLRYGITNSQQ